jgi:alkyl sulfatase BDS1-like metallo-beta-lactamase superfamily hydrolase
MKNMILGVLLGAGLVVLVAMPFRGPLSVLLAPKASLPPAAAETELTGSKGAAWEAAVALAAKDDGAELAALAASFVATSADPLIRNGAGEVIYDLTSYDFLAGATPDSVNPSLWRHARILTQHGLYRLSDRIYQVRGFDLSIVTFIDSGDGWIVVDPLTVVESAQKAKALVDATLGPRPIRALIYSHSHADHFGGALGMVSQDAVDRGDVAVLAPEGFLHHAIAENVIAGPAMGRRARFQFGNTLTRGPKGEVTSGLGPGLPPGTLSLLPPTEVLTRTGETRRFGDLTLEFQLTPGAEAPAEMNFYIPELRTLFVAENANLTLHNLLPARGALVRDAKAWADYLTETLRRYGDRSDLLFGAHGVPRRGAAAIEDFLSHHRDAYKYLHDQSVRLMNAGLTGTELAEALELPPPLAERWFNRGYYGTLNHNAKAVYQRYMGWYDGNPANLWPLPPEAESRRWIAALGGAEPALAQAQAAVEGEDWRWAATLLNRIIFAREGGEEAKALLASVYEQLAFRTEAGTWRNIYLTGAQELRDGVRQGGLSVANQAIVAATPTAMLLDFVAVRLNPEPALAAPFVLNLRLSDRKETHRIEVRNGVLIHEEGQVAADAPSLTLTYRSLLIALFGQLPPAVVLARDDVEASEGAERVLSAWLSMLDPLNPLFPIVTP